MQMNDDFDDDDCENCPTYQELLKIGFASVKTTSACLKERDALQSEVTRLRAENERLKRDFEIVNRDYWDLMFGEKSK